jgi:hypothetical protein
MVSSISSAVRTGAVAGIGLGMRRAEDRHETVRGHQRHDAAVAADRIEHQRVVGVEELDRLLGRLRFREGSEAADIGEHDGGGEPLAAEREPRLLQVLRDLAGGEPAHPLLLLVAQPLLLEARAEAAP